MSLFTENDWATAKSVFGGGWRPKDLFSGDRIEGTYLGRDKIETEFNGDCVWIAAKEGTAQGNPLEPKVYLLFLSASLKNYFENTQLEAGKDYIGIVYQGKVRTKNGEAHDFKFTDALHLEEKDCLNAKELIAAEKAAMAARKDGNSLDGSIPFDTDK